MTQTIIHFVHGNSFPAGTYRVFFSYLRHHYDVRALAMHAHNPQYPVRNGWHALMGELIAELVAHYHEPVVLVGHSMGGFLSLMVAETRPDLVRCVVLLDAPVVAGWRAVLLRTTKFFGLDERFSPAKFSVKRRKDWSDSEAAHRHFSSKALFANWPPEVLRDYIEQGLVPDKEGVTLRFTREIETAVYRSLPHHLGRILRGRFPVPAGFLGGADSLECRRAGLRATRRLVGGYFRVIPGGHLFPMESPALAAQATHEMIQTLLKSG